MNTITNNTHSRQLAGSSALLALVIGVLATFVMGFATPSAQAQYDNTYTYDSGFYTDGYCTGCGGSYDNTYTYDNGFYTNGYCTGCGSTYDNTYTYDTPYTYDNTYTYNTPYTYNNTYTYDTNPTYDNTYTYDNHRTYDNTYTYDNGGYVYPSEGSYGTYTSPYNGSYTSNTPYYAEASYGSYTPPTSTYTYAGGNYPYYSEASYGSYIPPTTTYTYQAGYQGSYQGSYQAGYQGTYQAGYQGSYEAGYQGSYQSYYQGSYTPTTHNVTCDISASNTSITAGNSTTLTWSSNYATSAHLSPGNGTVNTNGSRTVSPTSDTTYTLTVDDGQKSSQTCSVSVHVVRQNVSCDITADDTSLENGDSTRLRWNASNADNVSLNQGIGNVSSNSSRTISPSNTTTYTMTARNGNNTQTCDVTVHVSTHRNISCDISADNTNIFAGDSTVLRWSNSGSNNTRINQGIGSVSNNSGSTRVYPNVTTTYRMTTGNNNGDEETCDVTVHVGDHSLPPPPDVPLVYLSQLPYTGSDMDAGALMTYWLLIISGAGLVGYFLFFRVLPFAFAKASPVNHVASEGNSDGMAFTPANVTRQDVRAFVSALAGKDAAAAREFAAANGSALFSETAVVLDDVLRFRREGTIADSQVAAMTAEWSDEKVETLVDSLSEATDADATLSKVLEA